MSNIIDDGLIPELVRNAGFAGIFEFPVVEEPKEIVVPKALISFFERSKRKDKSEFVHFFYEFAYKSLKMFCITWETMLMS